MEVLTGSGEVVTATPDGEHADLYRGFPNPYGTLGCNCRETAPAGSPQLSEEINRGIREGLTVSVPGLPAPAQPTQR